MQWEIQLICTIDLKSLDIAVANLCNREKSSANACGNSIR